MTFHEVTNGFRSERGAQTYAALRSVVSTAKVNSRSVLGDLRHVLAIPSINQAAQPLRAITLLCVTSSHSRVLFRLASTKDDQSEDN